MEKEKKVTKIECLTEIKGIVESIEIDNKEELISFLDSQIDSITRRAEKAKERAAAKKAEGDELRDTVKSVLTTEFQTADEITEAIANDEISKAKVIARLTQLVNLGEAEKTDVKTDDNKTKKAYKLA